MNDEPVLFKGEIMEELLRNYFLSLGYYVVRSVKYKYQNNDITDVDLYIYGRSSSLTRQRINVDIKNKKSPQVFERILWANGLMKLLNFDSCIVATTDRRPVIHSFGQLHNTLILDGAFLSKIRTNYLPNRMNEEEFLRQLAKYKDFRLSEPKGWKTIYETSKSKLLTEQDFSGFNSLLNNLNYFFDIVITDDQKKDISTRMIYVTISHLLIIIDFIVKDIAFLEPNEREKRLSDGFKFGNLGKDGVDQIISMAIQIAGNKSASSFLKTLDNIPTNILRDFFSKNENAKNLYQWAKDFEVLGFSNTMLHANLIESPLKGIISVFLDYMEISRVKFFESYP